MSFGSAGGLCKPISQRQLAGQDNPNSMSNEQHENIASQITLPDLLKRMTDAGGSDLHLSTNSAPQVRVHGHLSALPGIPP